MTASKKQIRFTPAAIEKIPLTQVGRVLYWDNKCPGRGLSVGKTKKSYVLQGVIKGGREVRITLGVHGQGTWGPDTARCRAQRRT